MARKKLMNLKGQIYFSGKEIIEFAEDIDMHRGTLSSIINGHMIATPERKKQICKALGKSEKFLFEEGVVVNEKKTRRPYPGEIVRIRPTELPDGSCIRGLIYAIAFSMIVLIVVFIIFLLLWVGLFHSFQTSPDIGSVI